MPLDLLCPECNGNDDRCAACGGSGTLVIPHCPYKCLDSGTIRAIALARMAKEGSWPVTGGTLDQTLWFLDFCQAMWADEARAQQHDVSDEE